MFHKVFWMYHTVKSRQTKEYDNLLITTTKKESIDTNILGTGILLKEKKKKELER